MLKGFYLPSKCQCFFFHNEDNIHVLVNGLIAMHIWIWFDNMFKFGHFKGNLSIKRLFEGIYYNNVKGHIKLMLRCFVFSLSIRIGMSLSIIRLRWIIGESLRESRKIFYPCGRLTIFKLNIFKGIEFCTNVLGTFLPPSKA